MPCGLWMGHGIPFSRRYRLSAAGSARRMASGVWQPLTRISALRSLCTAVGLMTLVSGQGWRGTPLCGPCQILRPRG